MDGAGGVITGTGASGTAKAIGATGAGTTTSLSQFEACVPFPPGPVAQPASATTSRQNIQAPWSIPRQGLLPLPIRWGEDRGEGYADRLSNLRRVSNRAHSDEAPGARTSCPLCAPRSHPCAPIDRKSTRLNSSHLGISYAVFCL